MDNEQRILEELVKAKENIKRSTPEKVEEELVENDESIPVRKSKYNAELENLFNSPDFDKTYGPKKIHNQIILGKNVIKFTDGKLIVLDLKKIEYITTEGLLQLIFLKSPISYTSHDLYTYKYILKHTYAHLITDGSKVKKGGKKYINIISKLFPSGGGLRVKLQKNNLVYWDNPNEIIDRLKLLLASQAAGNTGVGNEILSIFEELLEAGLIKRIPNV
ncbi:Hypothetical protein CINCED_3A016122 [Cinara cedri]|uniref:DUF8207 domain-containing protein n=1 Tax=Cinara cedri TaxID=506608 RepID=A0A5E4N2M3_9HEMI|nr:Hypothetical protein CINCED_3A016122 [Cinara cedri]